MDDDQLRNGCSMIIDPFGDVVAECRALDNDMATAVLTKEKLTQAGGYRYLEARRPELYRDIIGAAHASSQKVVWLSPEK
jgi:predicted amidohydrolase